jgi:hypothetical protein
MLTRQNIMLAAVIITAVLVYKMYQGKQSAAAATA